MPIDYSLPEPTMAIGRGMQLGTALNQMDQARRDKEAVAEAQKRMVADLSAILAKGTPTASDYAALTIKYPHMNKQFEQAWGMLNEEQKTNRVGQVSEVYAALEAGEVGIAQDLLETQALAAENSGDVRSARAARTLAEIVNLNPDTAKTSVALRLSSMMGPDKFTETFTKLEADRRARQLEESDMTAAEAKAFKAAVDADFAESQSALDLQKKGWDITKIQNDIAVSKENQKIAALNAQLKREQNELKRDELQAKLVEMQRNRDEAVRKKVADAESARGNIDNMVNNVDRILQLPAGAINDAVGAWDGSWVGGVIDAFDEDVQNFKALMENLDAQAFLAQVPQMKGLGALSENEGKKLGAALQSFNTKQSEEQFLANLKETQRLMLKARENLALRYGIPDTIPDTPAVETSPEDIQALLAKYGTQQMATLAELELAFVNADKAGDADAARRLAIIIKREYARQEADPIVELESELPPGVPRGPVEIRRDVEVPGTTIPKEESGFLDKVTGTGEAALTIASSIPATLVGNIEGVATELATGDFGEGTAEKIAKERAQKMTFAPRTEAGQEALKTVAEVAEPFAGLPPVMGPATNIGGTAQFVKEGAKQTGRRLATPVKTVASEVSEKALEILQRGKPKPTATRAASTVGAQAIDVATLRQLDAEGLPVPIKLTEGQKKRDFETQRFERETAKLPEEGAPIRERFEQQNLQLQQNLDEFIDATGAQLTDLRGVGEIVDKALRNRAARDKIRIRSLYKEAEKAGEMEAPVSLENFIRHLDESAPEAEVANVLKAVRAKAIQLGAATEGPDGQLVPKAVSLKDAELLRRSINNATNAEPTNIRQAAIMKKLIDETTAGLGGDKYRKARAARAKYAQDYENVGLVKNLLGLKRGTEDRAIALEDVLRKSILEPSASLDSVRQLRRLLQTKSGVEGKQAWKELQGATLHHIQEQMTKGVTTNQRGDRIVSAAQLDRVITALDKTGKLDFVFGKKGAEQLRTINDVAKTVLTSPPGTVNTSNTATVLAGLMDVALAGTTGVPAPVATSFKLLTGKIKDAKLKARIKKTLGEQYGRTLG